MSFEAKFETVVQQFLKSLNCYAGKSFVSVRLKSHDFPFSFLSVTDLLDELLLFNIASSLSNQQLLEAPYPYLLELTSDGEVALIDSDKALNKIMGRVTPAGAHRVIMAERSATRRKVDSSPRDGHLPAGMIVLVMFFLLSYLTRFPQSNTSQIFLYFSYLLALAVSFAIIQSSHGATTLIADFLCSAGSPCSVKEREGSILRVLPSLTFAYYLFSLLIISTGLADMAVYNVTSMGALAMSMITLTIQVKRKQFCALCLALSFIILIQAAHFVIQHNIAPPGLNEHVWTAVGGMWLLSIGVTGLVNNLLKTKREKDHLHLALFKQKRNLSNFITLLDAQPAASGPAPHVFEIGNAAAVLQLTVVCSLQCTPCASAHLLLDSLAEYHGDALKLVILFHTGLDKSRGYAAGLNYIIQAIHTESADPRRAGEMLRTWYDLRDIKAFRKLYPGYEEIDATTVNADMAHWCDINCIKATPTVFIGGHQLPPNFTFHDLKWIVPRLSKYHYRSSLPATTGGSNSLQAR